MRDIPEETGSEVRFFKKTAIVMSFTRNSKDKFVAFGD